MQQQNSLQLPANALPIGVFNPGQNIVNGLEQRAISNDAMMMQEHLLQAPNNGQTYVNHMSGTENLIAKPQGFEQATVDMLNVSTSSVPLQGSYKMASVPLAHSYDQVSEMGNGNVRGYSGSGVVLQQVPLSNSFNASQPLSRSMPNMVAVGTGVSSGNMISCSASVMTPLQTQEVSQTLNNYLATTIPGSTEQAPAPMYPQAAPNRNSAMSQENVVNASYVIQNPTPMQNVQYSEVPNISLVPVYQTAPENGQNYMFENSQNSIQPMMVSSNAYNVSNNNNLNNSSNHINLQQASIQPNVIQQPTQVPMQVQMVTAVPVHNMSQGLPIATFQNQNYAFVVQNPINPVMTNPPQTQPVLVTQNAVYGNQTQFINSLHEQAVNASTTTASNSSSINRSATLNDVVSNQSGSILLAKADPLPLQMNTTMISESIVNCARNDELVDIFMGETGIRNMESGINDHIFSSHVFDSTVSLNNMEMAVPTANNGASTHDGQSCVTDELIENIEKKTSEITQVLEEISAKCVNDVDSTELLEEVQKVQCLVEEQSAVIEQIKTNPKQSCTPVEEESTGKDLNAFKTELVEMSKEELIDKVLQYESQLNNNFEDETFGMAFEESFNTAESLSRREPAAAADPNSDSSIRCKWPNCIAVFNDPSDLGEHVAQDHIKYSNDNFICHWETCARNKKPFMKRSRLISHMLTHTGEKPFVCPYPQCGKRFPRKDSLKYHINTHEKAKNSLADNAECCDERGSLGSTERMNNVESKSSSSASYGCNDNENPADLAEWPHHDLGLDQSLTASALHFLSTTHDTLDCNR
ncbi:hypothetical protein MP638_003885 [Amoeboaphelidium occidentale]|nr:hypothetical protein MP638_003885 [Amoeboaphelidium occidentale]